MAEQYEDRPIGAHEPERFERVENVWMRGLWMIILAILFGIGEAVLAISAVIQFIWMVFNKTRNQTIVNFGKDLGAWLRQVAEFQTGVTDEKPFPWKGWGA